MFLVPAFYAAVAAAYVASQVRLGLTRTAWFGAVNVAALAVLVPARALIVLAALTGLLWIGLRVERQVPPGRVVGRRILLWAIYGGLAALFFYHKAFLDFAFATAPRAEVDVARLLQLLAFSYVFLRMVDATRAVSAGVALLDPLSLSGYLAPFFMMPAGPVNSYTEHVRMNGAEPPEARWSEFVGAIDVVTSGLFLKFVVAEGLRLLVVGVNGPWPTRTVVDSAVIFVYVFFDFWGYSLVALGVGRLLGVPTPVNFLAPYKSQSVTEFWTRWHVSLGDFVRRSLFFPMQVAMVRRFGRRWAYLTNLVALTASFACIGLWHRLSPAFVTWGITVGIVVALEKVLRDRFQARIEGRVPAFATIQRFVGPIYVSAVVILTLHIAIADLMKGVQ